MAFEVTATKKRPQLFDELAGQEFVVSTLKSSLSSERIAHAYLFSGPRGVGKTSAARILARAVNCQEGPTDSPCGVCASCQEIVKGRSMDVIEIDGASNTSVNDIREIRDEVLFAPNSSRYKVYIIDEVHMLSNSAFNALLKTIEEPPPYIIFIFATTEIHKVPATIRSRCQQFNFRLISIEVIKGLLAKAATDEGVEAEEDALFWIAKEATGSMRDAFTLFDQVMAFSDGAITLEKIREKLGLVGLDKLNTLVETVVAGDGSAVMEQIDSILFQGVAVEQFVGDLGEYFRNLLFMRHGVQSESLLGYNPDRFSKIVRNSFTVEQLELTVEMIFSLFRDMRYSLNQRFELELLLSRISGLTTYLTPKQMLSEIKQLKEKLSQGVVIESSSEVVSEAQTTPPVENSSSPPPLPTEAITETVSAPEPPMEDSSKGEEFESDSVENIPQGNTSESPMVDMDAFRSQILGELRRKKMTLSSALEKAINWKLEEESLEIVFNNDFPARVARNEKKTIADKIVEMMGWNLKIIIKVVDNEVEESPLTMDDQVQTVKKVFRGEIIQGGA